MFTGLVEAVRPVVSIAGSAFGKRISIDLADLADGTAGGDSISLNGVCLTVSSLSGGRAVFDVMAQTLSVSTLSELKSSDQVNLERAMRPDGRLGGHIVQGHVDGIGRIERIDRAGGQWTISISAERAIMEMTIPKGSVAVDGVSLTIASVEVERGVFNVSLIPETLERTNLGARRPGDRLNIEVDIIGKWIKKRLDEMLGVSVGGELTMEKLRRAGFA